MLTLAVVQLEPIAGRLDDSVRKHARMADRAADLGAALVVFPELSLTGYSLRLTQQDAVRVDDPILEPIAEVSRRRGITAVVGAPLVSETGLCIASFALCPDDQTVTYTKQHLHPGEEVAFVAGRGGATFNVGDRRVGLAICAEINHPSHAKQTMANGADVYAASCFLTPAGYDADCRRLLGYASTYGVLVMMANFTNPCEDFESAGGSTIWDEHGPVAAAPADGEHLVLATRDRGRWVGSVHESRVSL